MAKLQPGTRQKLLFAAAALTLLLAPAPPVGAQTLAGLHIGDNLQAAIALYGQPRPYPSPFPGELWLLPNGDRLNVVTRNDKIVGLLLRGQASPTGFLGITFDVTTQARIVEVVTVCPLASRRRCGASSTAQQYSKMPMRSPVHV